ncbi:MAG TPA: ATP-binding protein [Gaiellaceae bacterium]|nr:ATP-binding protein [Gaiellaceae bacterium]
MRLGLTGRILIGGLLLAAFFLAQVVITYGAFRTIRHETTEEQRAATSVVVALDVEKLVLQLQSGARGYAITGRPSFLRPWREARDALPGRTRALAAYGNPAFARAISRQIEANLARSEALVRLASRSLPQARARVGATNGRYTRAIQRRIDGFVAQQQAVLAHDRSVAAHAENTGLRIGGIGIVVRALVFLAIIAYLLRAIVVPLRRIAAGTREVTAGSMGVEVAEHGAGEVGELARSFNEMSRSLASSQSALGEQNLRLERGATVLRAVLDSTVDGILLSDVAGNVRLANRPMLQLADELGLPQEGTVVERLLAASERMREPARFREAMERLRTSPQEATFDEFEDVETARYFQEFTSPVIDDTGTPIGRLWTLRDVTRQRELDRLKDEFIATVSHELRTPLTSMMGFLEMLREGAAGELGEEQQRFLAIVYRSSERLQRLVGDLLFIGRLDANGLQLQVEPVGVDEIVREAVESHAALARSRELELEADLEPVPALQGDPERLAQLLGNLVSNAVKFTQPGGRVRARTFVEADRAVIEVEDTGIGIPAAELPRVFERFFRSSTATEQAIPGTGLGLVISKAIAEAHGGTITVRSQAGRGTCFRVELPLARPVEAAAAA